MLNNVTFNFSQSRFDLSSLQPYYELAFVETLTI